MSNADHSVAMVALVQHPGYNYDGIPYQIVAADQKFNVTPARAARLLAKGIAKLDVTVPVQAESVFIPSAVIHLEEPDPGTTEPVKVDKRTKAYKAAQSK